MDGSSALRARYDSMIARMGLAPADYPLHFAARHDGGSHIEPLAPDGWRLRVTERGQVLAETRFADDEALLYRLVCDVAAAEGARLHAGQSANGKDPRRADFSRRMELVGKVSPAWRIRLAEELAQWLARHPYNDRPSSPTPSGQPLAKARKSWIGPAFVITLVLGLVLGWAVAHYPLWSVWQTQQRLHTEGFAVRAEVIERHRTDGRFADEYLLTYRYQGATRPLEGRDSVDWVTFSSVDYDGASIDVLYDPADQETSMVEGNDRAGWLAWIYAAIDALLALVIAWEWRKSRREGAAG